MEIKTYTPGNHYIKALIYGPSGSGKTKFGGTAKDALFLSAEGGLLSIKDVSPEYVDIKSAANLIEAYNFLKKGDHKYKTVVIDSITEISNTLKDEIEKKYKRDMQIQDWGELKKELISIFKDFRDLPMNVILLSQEAYITDEDKIRKVVPSLDGKGAISKIPYYMDIVGYIKVDMKGNRRMITDNKIKYVTKDRSECISDDCPLDFSEWEKRINNIKIKNQKIEEIEVETPLDVPPTSKEESKEFEDSTDYKGYLTRELTRRGAKTKEEQIKLLNKLLGKTATRLPVTNNRAMKAFDAIKKLPLK